MRRSPNAKICIKVRKNHLKIRNIMHYYAEFCILMQNSASKSANLCGIPHYHSHAEVRVCRSGRTCSRTCGWTCCRWTAHTCAQVGMNLVGVFFYPTVWLSRWALMVFGCSLKTDYRVLSDNEGESYSKDTEPLYLSFMYSLVSLLSGIFPFLAMHYFLVIWYEINLGEQWTTILQKVKACERLCSQPFYLHKAVFAWCV